MAAIEKPPSPFYTGKPLPPAFFVGREAQFTEILKQGVEPVAQGKPMALFVEGGFGIGKTSLAHVAQRSALNLHQVLPIRASLAGCKNLTDVASAILQGALDTNALDPKGAEAIKNWLGKHFIKTNLFGIAEIDMKALRDQAPDLANPFGMLRFLKALWSRLQGAGFNGIFLLLDELNGITSNEQFAHFIKGIVDTNSDEHPVPLLLMLAGTPERREEMISKHEPVNRIFKVIDVKPLSKGEVQAFFTKAFYSVNLTVETDAMKVLTEYSGGIPTVVQEIGDATYYANDDQVISAEDALAGTLSAAEEVGKKFVGPAILRAIKSEDYHAILLKLGGMGPAKTQFSRSELQAKLTSSEKGKLNNFLTRMKELNVLAPGERSGEYIFNNTMVKAYLWLLWFRTSGEQELR